MKIEDPHVWDWTNYCLFCGVAAEQEQDETRPCTRDHNVTAISHTVRGKRLNDLMCADIDPTLPASKWLVAARESARLLAENVKLHDLARKVLDKTHED